jgi:GTP cyclohydrolase II
MVEPSQFTEVYTSVNDVVAQSFANTEALCTHTFHIHRFHPEKVKTLNKYLEILATQKDNINSSLEAIQAAFDTIDSGIVLYLHNMEKVKTELNKLAELQINELETSKKLYATLETATLETSADEQTKPIIETGDKAFTEEMNKIAEYIDRF